MKQKIEHYGTALADALWDMWALYLGIGAAAIGYMFAPDDWMLRGICTFFAFVWALLLITGRANERARWQKAITDARKLYGPVKVTIETPVPDPPLWVQRTGHDRPFPDDAA